MSSSGSGCDDISHTLLKPASFDNVMAGYHFHNRKDPHFYLMPRVVGVSLFSSGLSVCWGHTIWKNAVVVEN